MNAINVRSEIGPLKKVLLHRPGNELLNLKNGNKVFIPVTGMRQYKLDPEYNQDLIGHGNFKKLTLSKILKLGYNISPDYKVFGNSSSEFKKFLKLILDFLHF